MKYILTVVCVIFSLFARGDDGSRRQAQALDAQIDLLIAELQATRDTSNYYYVLQKTIELAMRCDSLDALPNEKGKVKLEFRNANYKRLEPLRQKLIDAGLYFHQFRRNREAVSFFKTYVKSAFSPLFLSKKKKDLYYGQAAYYTALLLFGMKDYHEADRYSDIALKDEEYARDAAEIKVSCMKEMMKTPVDSARYFIALLELHDKAPQNRTYSHMLIEYLSNPGHEEEMSQFAIDELRKDSTNELNWALYGETQMRKKNWTKAVDAYKKATDLQPDFIEAYYNLGLSYCALVKDDLDKSDDTLSTVSKQRLEKAYDAFEKVKELDATQQQVSWAKPLYQVCLMLGKKEEAEKCKGELQKEQKDNQQ
jgi:tetratricopeptide (TPR) repeat protein